MESFLCSIPYYVIFHSLSINENLMMSLTGINLMLNLKKKKNRVFFGVGHRIRYRQSLFKSDRLIEPNNDGICRAARDVTAPPRPSPRLAVYVRPSPRGATLAGWSLRQHGGQHNTDSCD